MDRQRSPKSHFKRTPKLELLYMLVLGQAARAVSVQHLRAHALRVALLLRVELDGCQHPRRFDRVLERAVVPAICEGFEEAILRASICGELDKDARLRAVLRYRLAITPKLVLGCVRCRPERAIVCGGGEEGRVCL